MAEERMSALIIPGLILEGVLVARKWLHSKSEEGTTFMLV
jgi:hypothetical protein